MKILHLIPRFTAGGAEKLVLAYAKHLSESGVKVVVGSVVGGGELEEKFREKGIEIVVGGKRGFVNFWINYRNYAEITRKLKIEIIHSHVFSADVMGFLLARKLRIKWVSTQHNIETNAPLWRRLVWKIILRSADKVIAVSDSVYDFCLREWHLPKDKVVLIKNGIELEQWLSVGADELLAAPQLRLAAIGRLEKQKGHEILLRALAQLKIDWHLDVFGDGSLFEELRSLSRKLGIEKKIAWRGVVLNMPSELSKIDIVVQPSLWEGMSLVVMEAMASGRVVIVSEAAAVGLVEDNKTGIVAPIGDAQVLAEALLCVWHDKNASREIASAALEYAKRNFGIERNLKQVLEFYSALAEVKVDGLKPVDRG